MQPLEDRENLVGILHVHADTVVFYGELPRVSSPIGLHADLYLGRSSTSELNSISDEVLEELDELGLVAHDHWQRFVRQPDLNSALLDGGLEVVNGMLDGPHSAPVRMPHRGS